MPTSLAIISKFDNTKCWQGFGGTETLTVAGVSINC